MTTSTLTLATVASAKHAMGVPAWIETIVAIWLLCLALVAVIGLVIWRLCVGDGGNDESDDEGGGGGGGGGGRKRTPPRGSPGNEPEWWPEFEREFAIYVTNRLAVASLTRDSNARHCRPEGAE